MTHFYLFIYFFFFSSNHSAQKERAEATELISAPPPQILYKTISHFTIAQGNKVQNNNKETTNIWS